MNRPTLRLMERQPRWVRLTPAEADDLRRHARDVLDVQPGFARNRYRITPRDRVGWLDTPRLRLVIAPKLPWPNLAMLLGLRPQVADVVEPVSPEQTLLVGLAGELAARLREVAGHGWVAAYRERDTTSPFLRGRLRTAEQLRASAARAFPDRFAISEATLDLDAPWNRIPWAVATTVLREATLPATVRDELTAAVAPLSHPLSHLTPTPPDETDFAVAASEPRCRHYAELLRVCRVLHDGFRAARADDVDTGGAFLVNLTRAFEQYLHRGIGVGLENDDAPGGAGWDCEAQVVYPVGPLEVRPDLIVTRHGRPRFILDAKWKKLKWDSGRPAPEPGDLHQIITYATVTGAREVGIVYPGRRGGWRRFTLADGRIGVSLVRVQVVGPVADCDRCLSRFAHRIRKLARMRAR